MSGVGFGGHAAPNAGVTAVRVRAVPVAIDSIDSQLFRLEEVSSQLLSRISPLISPMLNGKGEPPASGGACEFASVLEGKADRIADVADRLSRALESLEF